MILTFQDFINYRKCAMYYYFAHVTNFSPKFIDVKDWLRKQIKRIAYNAFITKNYNQTELLKKYRTVWKFKEANVVNLDGLDWFEIGEVAIKNFVKYMKEIQSRKIKIIRFASDFEVSLQQSVVYKDVFDLIYEAFTVNKRVVVSFHLREDPSIITTKLYLYGTGYSMNYDDKALLQAVDLNLDGDYKIYSLINKDEEILEVEQELRSVIKGIQNNIYYCNISNECKFQCEYYPYCPAKYQENLKDQYGLW